MSVTPSIPTWIKIPASEVKQITQGHTEPEGELDLTPKSFTSKTNVFPYCKQGEEARDW